MLPYSTSTRYLQGAASRDLNLCSYTYAGIEDGPSVYALATDVLSRQDPSHTLMAKMARRSTVYTNASSFLQG